MLRVLESYAFVVAYDCSFFLCFSSIGNHWFLLILQWKEYSKSYNDVVSAFIINLISPIMLGTLLYTILGIVTSKKRCSAVNVDCLIK
jgi:hypothetical protein